MPVKATGWPSISRVFAPILRPLSPIDHGLWRTTFGLGRKPQAVELAIKGRTADLQPPRHFGHLSAIMGDSEAYDFPFDLLQRANVARGVEQRQPGVERGRE